MLIVTAQNVSDLAPTSDYDVEVRINEMCIAQGMVYGHERSDGWAALLRRIADLLDA